MQITNLWPAAQGELRKKIMHYSYFLVDRIGDGFSSTVYIGTDDHSSEKVAIKVIDLKFLHDENKKKLLANELECIRKIGHAHLLQYIDTYETTNNVYIITEYCEGGDMDKQLRHKGRLTEAQFGEFFAQFYSGYVNLLDAGFIHRDIKPANIFLKKGKIKVADFGIVKKTSQNPRDTFNVGTLVYMAPESIVECIYNEKSDVWSMGVMFYQLTHGGLPWKLNSASDKKATINQILNATFAFDRSWLSNDCIRFIEKCMHRNPIDRFEVKQMMEHPWAKKAIKNFILNEQQMKGVYANEENSGNSTKGSTSNKLISGVPNQARQGLQLQKSNSLQNNIRFTRDNSGSNSPHKSVSLNFIGSSENISNNYQQMPREQRIGQSPFQRMRQKLTANTSGQSKNDGMDYMNPYAMEHSVTQIHNYLLSVVNYLRYIHQVIGFVSSLQSVAVGFKNQLLLLLVSELMQILVNVFKIVTDRSNVFCLSGWEQYVSSNFWEADADLLKGYEYKYRLKYQILLNNLKSQQNKAMQPKLSSGLNECIMHISSTVSKAMPAESNDLNLFELIKATDVLSTLLQLNEGVILMQDQAFFRSKFDASQIVAEWPAVNLTNHMAIWQVVKAKLETLLQP